MPHKPDTVIAIRQMGSEELFRLAQIDRSERVRIGYRMEDGVLVEEEVEWDVPEFIRQGDGDHSVAEQIIFCRSHLDRDAIMLGAFESERLVGIGLLTPNIRPQTAQLAYLQVSAGHRRRGIASHLTQRLIDLARELQAESIYVSATPTKSAIGFYRSLGFEPLAEPFPDLYTLEPDDIHMWLDLEE